MLGTWRRLGLLVALWCVCLEPAAAEIVILRDGFTIRGKLLIEGQILRDPGGREFWIKKLGGFYMIHDGARRIVFSTRQVVDARPDPADRESLETIAFKHPLLRTEFSPSLRTVHVEEAEEWSPQGTRKLVLRNDLPGGGTKTFEQAIVHLNPHYFRVAARRVRWDAYYLTSELDPAVLVKIARQAVAQLPSEASERDHHLSLARFLRQAGLYAQAEEALRQFQERSPADEAVDEALRLVQKKALQSRIEAAELALSAGQFRRAQEQLQNLPAEQLDPAEAARITALRTRLEEAKTKLALGQRLLEWVVAEVKDEALMTRWSGILQEISNGLHPDTCARLDPFVALALQEERRHNQGQQRQYAPEELLALAVSGWLLGPTGAETDPRLASQLWQTRQFLGRYLRAKDPSERTRLLDEYLQGQPAAPDVVRQMLPFLPPVEPPSELAGGSHAIYSEQARGIPYSVILPPEYHPHRSYPLLLVLPNVREPVHEALARWQEPASRHGYLLAAPQWASPLQEHYKGQEADQQAVLAVLRDLRHRFNIDADRIFLAGMDQAGSLAYDLALAHPDYFAGVVVFCAKPSPLAQSYRGNAQYLPFYVVEGEKSPNNTGENRQLFEYWVNRGFASLYVEYTGRGLEFFPGELPYIFDWLSRRKRASGLPELGGTDPVSSTVGRSFVTQRPAHNRFYWVSGEDLAVGDNRTASIAARIVPAENGIVVQHSGFRKLRIWLNSAMVDFRQPVSVRVHPGSGTVKTFRGQVAPDLRVLLEDFAARGDAGHLYVARVDLE